MTIRASDAGLFPLLFVCTGNCRSPAANLLLRTRLDELLGPEARLVDVTCAGLGTPAGQGLDPRVAQLLRSAGIEDVDQFRSRCVDADVLADADLVLTGTKQHRLAIGAN